MIVPSIDLIGGNAVQLVGGKELAIDAGDPLAVAERFAVAGELAVIDLDAALGRGDNRAVIEALVRRYDCRVGGGIRSYEVAKRWLDAGASKILLGTAARPELLRRLPRQRVMAAVDAFDGQVVVDGWRTKTGASLVESVAALAPYVSGFLVTFVEREGRLGGTAMERVAALKAVAGDARLTIAGGITTVEEVAALDQLGCDAQVGMALYTGRMSLGAAVAAPLVSDRSDGLFPTVVCDERGVALGLCYSDRATVAEAVNTRTGIYRSRRRGRWVKGETSGATQELVRVDLDCDRDALRFTVRQRGGFCHLPTRTCWGEDRGVGPLWRTLRQRLVEAPEGSYTRRLFDDPALLRAKLAEEAAELAAADTPPEVAWETADLLYFALVAAVRGGASLDDVERTLDLRARRVTRRPGDAKETT